MKLIPGELKRPGYLVLLVTGGRHFDNHWLLHDWLGRIADEAEDRRLLMIVLQGGAGGTDRFARDWAEAREMATDNGTVWAITEPAMWEDLAHPNARIRTREDGTKYDASAGIRRNQLMLDKYDVDLCLAMPGGNGTADMVRRCRAAGIPILP